MICPKQLTAIAFILLIIISIISPLSITIMIIIGALFNFSSPSPQLILPQSQSLWPQSTPLQPTSLQPTSLPPTSLPPTSLPPTSKYLGAIDEYEDDNYINNDVLSSDDASGDDKIACASKRNTHERVTVGTMNRHNLIDKCVREELECAEDIMWWGRNEN